MKAGLRLAIVALLFAACAYAQQRDPGVSFATRLEKTAVWVGDQFHYQIFVDHSPGIQFILDNLNKDCLLYTSPSPRDRQKSRMPSSA